MEKKNDVDVEQFLTLKQLLELDNVFTEHSPILLTLQV